MRGRAEDLRGLGGTVKQENPCERSGEAAVGGGGVKEAGVGGPGRSMVGKASPEKEGWERREGDVVKAARGGQVL